VHLAVFLGSDAHSDTYGQYFPIPICLGSKYQRVYDTGDLSMTLFGRNGPITDKDARHACN